jgi:hypothetical protein
MKDFKWVIQSNQIKNCPVTVQDIDVAQKIWGKNIAALKGKTTRRKSIPVARDYVKVPMELMKLHKEVFLTTYIFFVKNVPFFLTLSCKICFTEVNHLADRMVPQIFKAFKEMYQYYLQRGFHIKTVHADGDYVPEIESRIQEVRKRCRATRHNLPFETIPKLMTIHIVLIVVKLLNFFPTMGGVSDTLSPKTIMSGETLDFKKHLSLQIGQYCQVYEEDNPQNSQVARTKGAISLGPSGNLQGGFKFMALNSGNKILQRSWEVIPMSDVVINRVNELGKDQPSLMMFTDRHGRLIRDIEIPGVDSTEDEDDYFPGVATVIADAIEIPGVDVAGPKALDEVRAQQVEIYDPDDIPHDDPAPIEVVPAQAVPVLSPVAPPAETGLRRSTRVRTQASQGYTPSMTGSKYSDVVTKLESQGVLYPDAHMFVQDDFYQAEPDVVAAIITKLLLKAGLKEWGKKGFKAAHSEMKKLHLSKTFKPNNWRELSKAQRQTVLESHMFLKLKQDGNIKGRNVAGGNKQHDYISNEDASSPTVAAESVLLSCIIDAEKHRDVAVVDIPIVFVQTCVENEKDMAFIKIRGILVDILVEISPEAYKSYVSQDKKGNKQFLVQCQNALYVTMVAILLYYRKLVKSLTDIDFIINPYDPCVASKIIEGEQMIICFHVDDCKISHSKKTVMDRMIGYLWQEYERIFEDGSGSMTVSREKIHKYIGMTLDYSVPGQLKITMLDYVDEILAAFEKAEPKGGGRNTSAAPDILFKVD